MEQKNIKVGLTQGDINGTGYEMILKAFEDPTMLELCTPTIFGSPKVAAFHKKTLGMELTLNQVATADEAQGGSISIVNACDDEVKVELGKRDPLATQAALSAVRIAVEELSQDMFETLVMLPMDVKEYQSQVLPLLKERFFPNRQPLTVLCQEDLRIALATDAMPLSQVEETLDAEMLRERILDAEEAMEEDFGIKRPRIAVLSLNPQGGKDASLGEYEQNTMLGVMEELKNEEHLVYGPYSADYMMQNDLYSHFDGILALTYDQGITLFRAVSRSEGAQLLTGGEMVITSPMQGVGYDYAGLGVVEPDSLRQAIYLGMDVLRQRRFLAYARRNSLRKQYFDRRDDSDKLKQLQNQED